MQPGTTSAFKQPSDPNICSGTNYLQRWNAFKRTKTAFRASCDCWEMPEPWLTWELGYFYPKLFTSMKWRNGWWKLVNRSDMCCVYNSVHSVFIFCLSLVQRSEIKRGIWPGNITMWLHAHKAKLEVASINDTSRKQQWKHASEFSQPPASSVFFLLIFFFVWHPKSLHSQQPSGSWCDVSHRSHRSHLQSSMLLRSEKRSNFRKPIGVPTTFCHCVGANSSTYRPTQTCCFYNHPESTRQCKNQKNNRAGYLKGGTKNPPSTLCSG